jgi:hypothetical protein
MQDSHPKPFRSELTFSLTPALSPDIRTNYWEDAGAWGEGETSAVTLKIRAIGLAGDAPAKPETGDGPSLS